MVTSHVYSVDDSTRADIAKDGLEEVQKSELGSIPRFFKSCQWKHRHIHKGSREGDTSYRKTLPSHITYLDLLGFGLDFALVIG